MGSKSPFKLKNMKKLTNKLGKINTIGLIIVLTTILPLIVSITIKVLTTKNIIL